MKNVLIFIGIVLFVVELGLVSVFASYGNNPISKFEVDIYGPPASIVNVSVPDRVDLGNLSYNSYSDDVKVYVNNTGNVAVKIKPVLVNNDDIYANLYFRKRTSGNESTFTQIGNWSMNISSPGSSGVESDWFYTRLDLRAYTGTISSDMLDRESDVKFVVTQLQYGTVFGFIDFIS